MLMPMRFNSASAAGSESEIPAARVTCSTEGVAAVLDGFCLPDRVSAMVAAMKPLTDVPAATAALSIASRCSIGTRSEITLVFGVLLLTGQSSLGRAIPSPARIKAAARPSASDDTELKTASAFTIPHLAMRAAGSRFLNLRYARPCCVRFSRNPCFL